MKVYKQMKMYNDDDLNPVLREAKKIITTKVLLIRFSALGDVAMIVPVVKAFKKLSGLSLAFFLNLSFGHFFI